MRHKYGNKKLGKPTDQRLALLKSIVGALFTYKAIQTTDARAKEAKKLAEKLITLAKKGDLSSRRLALKLLPQKDIIKELFVNIADNYKERKGGFTRIVKIGFRRGDSATISRLELIN